MPICLSSCVLFHSLLVLSFFILRFIRVLLLICLQSSVDLLSDPVAVVMYVKVPRSCFFLSCRIISKPVNWLAFKAFTLVDIPVFGRANGLLSKPVYWLMYAIIASITGQYMAVLMIALHAGLLAYVSNHLIPDRQLYGRANGLLFKPVYWLMSPIIASRTGKQMAVLMACLLTTSAITSRVTFACHAKRVTVSLHVFCKLACRVA